MQFFKNRYKEANTVGLLAYFLGTFFLGISQAVFAGEEDLKLLSKYLDHSQAKLEKNKNSPFNGYKLLGALKAIENGSTNEKEIYCKAALQMLLDDLLVLSKDSAKDIQNGLISTANSLSLDFLTSFSKELTSYPKKDHNLLHSFQILSELDLESAKVDSYLFFFELAYGSTFSEEEKTNILAHLARRGEFYENPESRLTGDMSDILNKYPEEVQSKIYESLYGKVSIKDLDQTSIKHPITVLQIFSQSKNKNILTSVHDNANTLYLIDSNNSDLKDLLLTFEGPDIREQIELIDAEKSKSPELKLKTCKKLLSAKSKQEEKISKILFSVAKVDDFFNIKSRIMQVEAVSLLIRMNSSLLDNLQDIGKFYMFGLSFLEEKDDESLISVMRILFYAGKKDTGLELARNMAFSLSKDVDRGRSGMLGELVQFLLSYSNDNDIYTEGMNICAELLNTYPGLSKYLVYSNKLEHQELVEKTCRQQLENSFSEKGRADQLNKLFNLGGEVPKALARKFYLEFFSDHEDNNRLQPALDAIETNDEELVYKAWEVIVELAKKDPKSEWRAIEALYKSNNSELEKIGVQLYADVDFNSTDPETLFRKLEQVLTDDDGYFPEVLKKKAKEVLAKKSKDKNFHETLQYSHHRLSYYNLLKAV